MSGSELPGVTGLDVSKWQATTPRLAGHDFLFARATIGTKADAMYQTHIANARKAGLLVGAYHFNHAPISVASQVAAFLAVAGDVDLYALDVEGADAFSKAQAADFIKRVQATGRKCGLYHSLSGFFDAGQDFDWIAYWSDQPPTRSWDIWQFGPIDGIDGNRYIGTRDQLKALAGRSTSDVKFIMAGAPGKLLRVPAGTDLFDFDGVRVTEVENPKGDDLPFLGYADGRSDQYVVEVTTGRVYTGGRSFPTWLIAKTGALIDAPTATLPPDTTPFTQQQLDAATAVARGEGADEGAATERSRLRQLLGI